MEVISASGNVLDTKGKTKVCFVINGNSCIMDVVVTSMDIDVIIEFMLTHNVVVDIVGMAMYISEKACPLFKVGKTGCYRVIVSERVPVPNRTKLS